MDNIKKDIAAAAGVLTEKAQQGADAAAALLVADAYVLTGLAGVGFVAEKIAGVVSTSDAKAGDADGLRSLLVATQRALGIDPVKAREAE